MTEIQRNKTTIRLQKYLELVKNNISGSSGELQEFWKREEKKTSLRIGKL